MCRCGRKGAAIGGWFLVCAAFPALGCKSEPAHQRLIAAPTQEEIPEIRFPQSTFPVSVGVLGATRRDPYTPFLQKFEPAKPTEEERRILEAHPEPRKYDFLATYPGPPSGTVAQLDTGGPAVGIAGRGGASAYQIMPAVKSGVHGHEGQLVGKGPGKEFSASLPNPRTPPSGVGNEHMVEVGRIPSTPRTHVERRREQD